MLVGGASLKQRGVKYFHELDELATRPTLMEALRRKVVFLQAVAKVDEKLGTA